MPSHTFARYTQALLLETAIVSQRELIVLCRRDQIQSSAGTPDVRRTLKPSPKKALQDTTIPNDGRFPFRQRSARCERGSV
jgi:hypothetical protein